MNRPRLATPGLALLATLATLLPLPRDCAAAARGPAVETLGRRSGVAAATNPSDALTPERSRLTDEDIARDLATFDRWQERIDSLASSEPRPSVYHLATAQGLVNLARQQYERGDRCGAVAAALDQGARLIERMRAGERDLPVGPPPILGAAGFRPDLWQRAADLRPHPGFRCIEAQVARGEAMLLRAAHEAQERQRCDSARIVGEAVALLDEARAAAEACVEREAAPPSLAAINPRGPERRAALVREIEALPRYVRFALDSSSVDPATSLILELVADKLTRYTEIRVRVSGHAVSRASLAYNLLLAKQRAESVRNYLLLAGIADDRVDAEHHATPMPLAPGEKVDAVARDHCVVLEYIVSGLEIPGPPAPPVEEPAPAEKPRRQRP